MGQRRIERIAMITNPAAGKGTAVRVAQAARNRFSRHGIDVVSLQGVTAERSLELAEDALEDPHIDALVVCGGDGLINLALQVQARSEIPLGIIPAGTGNDHAREYDLPLDPERAADVIAEGFYTTADLGLITADDGTTRWFGTIACAGFDSLVTDRTNRMVWPKGRNRYNLAIGVEVLSWKTFPTKLVLDHERVVEVDAKLCSVGNTRTYGGGMHICPNAEHDDGLFDITVLEDIGRVRAAGKFARILRDTLGEGRGMSFYRASHVRVEMDTDMNCYADGDLMAPLPIELEVVPGAGRYLVPRPS